MTQTLGQIVAVHREVRTEVENSLIEKGKRFRKETLFTGLSRTHVPDEGYLQLDPEIKPVQANATEMLDAMKTELTNLINLTATKDLADTYAHANVVVDGEPLLSDVPVAHLLWLEKRLTEMVNDFKVLPVISPLEQWDAERDGLPRGIRRTKPDQRPSQVKEKDWKQIVPPTDKFPADVRETSRDVKSGVWTRLVFSGGMEPQDKQQLVRRAQQVLYAVKKAISVANRAEVDDVDEATPLLGFIFGDVV